MVEVGQPAPDFTLQDQDGHAVTLSAFRGSPVVLYFYPKDDTPGCTTEACAFRDAEAAYKAAGARVIGVSPDGVKSHRKFADKHRLPFTLVADTERKVCEAYGVWQEKTLYGKKSMGVVRSTFIIDKRGMLKHALYGVSPRGHAAEVLGLIKGMQKCK